MPLPYIIGMAATESLHRTSFATDHHLTKTTMGKPMPILTTTSSSPTDLNDPMDITPTSASMPPPNHSSPQSDKGSEKKLNGDSENMADDVANQPTGAAAAANQPTKVVQTAFIHKLYK
jgi:hypothetical protein